MASQNPHCKINDYSTIAGYTLIIGHIINIIFQHHICQLIFIA